MGGRGSGNHFHWWRSGKKITVEDCLSLAASRWMRERILRSSIHLTGSWQWRYRSGKKCSISYEVQTTDMARPLLRLSYSWPSKTTGQQESADYHVRLTTTRPQFGGLRW